MKRSPIVILTVVLSGCMHSGSIDRKLELDSGHPSVFALKPCSYNQVRNSVTGCWTGYRSCLTPDTSKGLYQLEIKHYGDNSFRLIENKIERGGASAKTTITAELVNIEGVYVFRYALAPGNSPVMHLSYLSDKQLKLDELLFEKAGAI